MELDGKTVAIIATDLFEEAELTEPRRALERAGAKTFVLSPHAGEIQGMRHDEKSAKIEVDETLDKAAPEDFDAVLLPGGAMNADALRMDNDAREFVRAIDEAGKPIGVICHGAWLLASANLVNHRTLTSYYTIQDDLRNAGANWLDAEVQIDENWVSSRQPDDIPNFSSALVNLIAEH